MDRHSKRSVLSVNGKKLRRPCLDRFAVFAKASRNTPAVRPVGWRLQDCAWEICKPRSGVKSSAPLNVRVKLSYLGPGNRLPATPLHVVARRADTGTSP